MMRNNSLKSIGNIFKIFIRHNRNICLKTKEDLSNVRNIGIIAHIDAGKTTSVERMLYFSGFSSHLGDIDDGDTVMDYMEEERERGITIQSAAITFNWNKYKINLIDTPGHIDFTFEVERALRVLDGAITIIDAAAGVEAQTKTVWDQAEHFSIPSIIFLNKMDKPTANIDLCINSIKKKLKITPVLINKVINCDRNYLETIDIIKMKKLTWCYNTSQNGRKFSVHDLSKDTDRKLWDECMELRSSLIGHLTDYSHHLESYILADEPIESIPSVEIYRALRKATISRKVAPVLCGSALRNMGIQPLMDAVCHYLPNPLQRSHDVTMYYGNDLCALAFKTIHHKNRGMITYLRLYSGMLSAGDQVYNVSQQCKEKVDRLIEVYADTYRDIQKIGHGNIVSVSGLKLTKTGDTITSSRSAAIKARNHMLNDSVTLGKESLDKENENSDDEYYLGEVVLAGLEPPPPVFFCSVEPPSISEWKKLKHALDCLQQDDPSLHCEFNQDTLQTILSGMGELHLEVVKHRLQQEYNVEAYMGPLQVTYRESMLGDSVVQSNSYEQNIGGRLHEVNVNLKVNPDPAAKEFKHYLKNVDRTAEEDALLEGIPWKYKQAINNGIKSALQCGPKLGYPLCNISVELISFGCKYKTSTAVVRACVSQCVRNAVQQESVLFEPMMELVIKTTMDLKPVVISDIVKRRGYINDILSFGDGIQLNAIAPLAELKGYVSSFRALTSGQSSCSMQFSHYEQMNPIEQNNVIKAMKGEL